MDDIKVGRGEVESFEEEDRICHSVGHPYVGQRDFDLCLLLPEGMREPSQYRLLF